MIDRPKYTDDPILAPFIAQLPRRPRLLVDDWPSASAPSTCTTRWSSAALTRPKRSTLGRACDQALRELFRAE